MKITGHSDRLKFLFFLVYLFVVSVQISAAQNERERNELIRLTKFPGLPKCATRRRSTV
ncbi:MAG: hypothetical protein LUM44_08050 [Pyrinomonadaceae bacterium]|nr:hypothetical protein [Pyrinomonadaceae bacterium]